MKGTITYFNADENTGAIQSDDGLLLNFSTESLAPNQDESKLINGCRVDFNLEDKIVVNMLISKEQNLLEDNIFYLAAYDSPEEYFVIFFESEDGRIERENEYYCAVYHKEADRERERYSGYTYEYPWAMIIQMMDVVNNS